MKIIVSWIIFITATLAASQSIPGGDDEDTKCLGKSCKDIYALGLAQCKSDKYSIESGTVVHCNMELECGGHKGGWTRVASFDTTLGDGCPQGWRQRRAKNRTYCVGGKRAGCYSAWFSTANATFSRVCGRMRGYQRGSMNAFFPAGYALRKATGYTPDKVSATINGPYVDGVSITFNKTPRKHLWTYAVGLSDDYWYNYTTGGGYNCPCAKNPGPDPPSFVENHYHCESGNTGIYTKGVFYDQDALWDGKGCPTSSCCSKPGLPWFYRQFVMAETGDMEVRICRDQARDDEETLVDQLELYIQ